MLRFGWVRQARYVMVRNGQDGFDRSCGARLVLIRIVWARHGMAGEAWFGMARSGVARHGRRGKYWRGKEWSSEARRGRYG